MSEEDRSARRYHWLSDNVTDFVVEPENAIVGDVKRERALNMVAKESEAARKASVDLAKEPTRKLMNLIQSTAKPLNQKSLQDWLPKTGDPWQQTLNSLNMPRNINWDTLSRVYEFQPTKLRGTLKRKRRWTSHSPRFSSRSRVGLRREAKLGRPSEIQFRLSEAKTAFLSQLTAKQWTNQSKSSNNQCRKPKSATKKNCVHCERLRRFVPENANS